MSSRGVVEQQRALDHVKQIEQSAKRKTSISETCAATPAGDALSDLSRNSRNSRTRAVASARHNSSCLGVPLRGGAVRQKICLVWLDIGISRQQKGKVYIQTRHGAFQ